MLEREKIRPQNVIYKKYTRRELPLKQNWPCGSVSGKKTNHLPGRGMGSLPIRGQVGKDHRQIECSCDVGGPEYPWPAFDGEMKSIRVGLALGCHRVVELDDHPRVEKSTRCHERL